MKFTSHLFIFGTIFSGFWLDSLIAEFNIRTYIAALESLPYLVETSLGFLILCYWIYAIPEKIQSSAAFCYGLLVDLCFGSAIGFNMFFSLGSHMLSTSMYFAFEFFLTYS